MLALLIAFTTPLFWQDPGSVESADLGRAGATPKPPLVFLREDLSGTGPKIVVRDSEGIEWRMKGGREGQTETFITRFVRALGFYAEATVFSAAGKVEKVPRLKRTAGFLEADGSYTWASFEKIGPDAKFTGSWNWRDPSLRHRRELKGLKILVMLFSNWDNKDSRDVHAGSNTSILQFSDGRTFYFVNDWGQSFGSWGRFYGRTNWNCKDYEQQTPQFVLGVRKGLVRFGYTGSHTMLFRHDIGVEDVRWLMQYLGRVTDEQVRAGLKSAGATQAEEDCFARALRARIEQLRQITLQ